MEFSLAMWGAIKISTRKILLETLVDRAWYLGKRIMDWTIGPTTRHILCFPLVDIFWGKDMVGPTLESALIESNHQLHLEPEGVSYMETIIPQLVDGVTSSFVPASSVGISSSSAHQVCLFFFNSHTNYASILISYVCI